MAGPHHNTIQDGQVGLLVPAFQVSQAVAQVAAHPGLEDDRWRKDGSPEGGCKLPSRHLVEPPLLPGNHGHDLTPASMLHPTICFLIWSYLNMRHCGHF